MVYTFSQTEQTMYLRYSGLTPQISFQLHHEKRAFIGNSIWTPQLQIRIVQSNQGPFLTLITYGSVSLTSTYLK